jgi:hypothetical protein
MQATTQYFVKRFFYKQVEDFHRPSKILCQTSGHRKSLVPILQLLNTTYGIACTLFFLFGACLLPFLLLLTASFFFDLPLAELSGVQKDLVGLGAIYVHNETHSAGISVRTKTNNLQRFKIYF